METARIINFTIDEVKEGMKDLAYAITKAWNSKGYSCFVLEDDGSDKEVGIRYRISTPLYRVTIEERKTTNENDIFPPKGCLMSADDFEPGPWGERIRENMITAYKAFDKIITEGRANHLGRCSICGYNEIKEYDHIKQKVVYKCQKCGKEKEKE